MGLLVGRAQVAVQVDRQLLRGRQGLRISPDVEARCQWFVDDREIHAADVTGAVR